MTARSSNHLALGAAAACWLAVLATSPAAHAETSVHFVDGVYGRFDGDFDLSLSAGSAISQGGPTAAFFGRALFLGTTGPYVEYVEGFGSEAPVPRRSLALGVGFRPLWIPRWGLNLEHGPAVLDLTLDATTFDLGVLWPADPTGHWPSHAGMEIALGTEAPLWGQAEGPWIGVRGALRWHASELGAQDDNQSPLRPALFLTLGWHFVANTHLVDVGDRFLH